MESYFNLRYEFDPEAVRRGIDAQLATGKPGYICVADGVVLDIANRRPGYLRAVNGGMFCVCDSSYVPLYLRWLYGIERRQYSGSELFMDVIRAGRHRMMFLGAQKATLRALRARLVADNPAVKGMRFVELPFRDVEDFDYEAIAREVNRDGADVIWVSLGAPKQELFMARLRPHLRKGVMIAVGAAFKFHSGIEVGRAPEWMVRTHTEFVHRIAKEPRKQLRRCRDIVLSLPRLLLQEWRRKQGAEAQVEEAGSVEVAEVGEMVEASPEQMSE